MNWNKFLFAGYATFYIETPLGKSCFRVIKDGDSYAVQELTDCNPSDPFAVTKDCGILTQNFNPLVTSVWSSRAKLLNLVVRCLMQSADDFLHRYGIKVFHAGYCANCNRVLKTPEAIQHGIGNECFKDMNINPKEKIVYVGLTSDQDAKSNSSGRTRKRRGSKGSIESCN
jgi:hypothetical protein